MAGVDVLARPRDVRRRIGLSGQYAAVDEYLTGFENLDMIGRLYHLGVKRSRERARELLASFRLEDAADRPSKTYSGGMRRRLDLAGALVADPPIIFLDEPTTGLDPRGRTEMWEVIQGLVAGGTTLLLTTQYLEEADTLADEIIVIDRGRVIAAGTPTELKDQAGRASVVLTLSNASEIGTAAELIRSCVTEVHVEEAQRRLIAPADDLSDMTRIAELLQENQIEVDDLGLKRPSLDDVFLHLTGHRAEQDDEPSDEEPSGDDSVEPVHETRQPEEALR